MFNERSQAHRKKRTVHFHLCESLEQAKLIYGNGSQKLVASGRSKLPTIVHRKTFWVMGNVLYPNFGGNYIGIYNCKNETEPLRFIHFIVCKLYIVLKKL